jgi:hypothetical protein
MRVRQPTILPGDLPSLALSPSMAFPRQPVSIAKVGMPHVPKRAKPRQRAPRARAGAKRSQTRHATPDPLASSRLLPKPATTCPNLPKPATLHLVAQNEPTPSLPYTPTPRHSFPPSSEMCQIYKRTHRAVTPTPPRYDESRFPRRINPDPTPLCIRRPE